MRIRKLLLLPQLLWYGARAPRDQGRAWDRFWAGIRRTGPEGDVLWDAAYEEELTEVVARALAHMDTRLPLVDVGCGNGRFSRLFAAFFPRVVGVDVSSSAAIQRATEESRGVENLTLRVLDASAPGVGAALAAEFGDVNVFMRGVFHVFDSAQRRRAALNLRDMVGERGVIYCAETNYEGEPLDQLVAQGATPTSMPAPLRRCIEAGIRPPRRFGQDQIGELFPREEWEFIEGGPTTMCGLPLTTKGRFEPIPSYYALLRRAPRAT